jgi:spore coat protein CotH
VEQKTYIQNYIADFENALKGPDYTDDLLGYPNYIDVDSFIDYFIISELSKNIDAYRLSTYLVKDKEQKLAMGPVWDFNLALGNAGFCNGEDTQGWAFEFNSICPNDAFPVPFWWPRLISDPNFSHQVKARWAELRADVLSDTNINQLIDQHNGILTNSNSLDANFEKWDIIDQWFWSTAHLVDTHQEEVDYLKQWINNRTLWLDANIPSL